MLELGGPSPISWVTSTALSTKQRTSLKWLGGEAPVVPLPDFADAYEVQRVLAAVVESDKNRSPVAVSELK